MAGAFYFVGVIAGIVAAYFGYCAYTAQDIIRGAGLDGNTIALFQMIGIQQLNVAISIGSSIVCSIFCGVGAIIEVIARRPV